MHMKLRMLLPAVLFGVAIAARPAPTAPTVEIAIGKSIDAGMPVDTASTFDAAVGTVACWTRLTGGTAGSTITHVWMHGSDSTKIELKVGGSPWRTYSRKNVS